MKALLLIALAPALAFAQPKPAAILDDLAATLHPEQATISPDGQRVAWVEPIFANGRDTGKTAVYFASLDGKRPRTRLGNGRGVAWSHDSKQLAFVDDQLYVATIGGATRRLTKLKGYMAAPQWAADDKRLAVLYVEQIATVGGPLGAEPVQTGVIGSEIHNQRLTLVDARSGAAKQLSPPELNVYEYDWSPDATTFALTAAPGPADNNWWVAQLYTMPADTGVATAIHRPPFQIAAPQWSPDGATIGFIGGLMSDEGLTGGDLFTIAATGGAAIDRTAGRPTSVNTFAWQSPTQITIAELVDGSSAIATLDLASAKVEQKWRGDGLAYTGSGLISISRDGQTFAAIRSDWQHPPEVWAGPLDAWKPITSLNASHHPMWGDGKSITWTSDNLAVQGWLVYPRDFDPTKTYPLVVEPHGGPAWQEMAGWPGGLTAVLSAFGYFVLLPNVRGSYGKGEAFTRANIKDFGGGDLRDLLAGVDAAVKAAPIDPNRVGITGWSYGGYMTMWAITQTTRFKAAIAGAGISNWQSYYGENAIDQWMIPYFGASVYDAPATYAKSSPMTFVKRVKTPTLIIVGERDGECPAPQSFELWHALRTLGVPTDLVVYAGEGHKFKDPAHIRDLLDRAVAWFDKYLR